jgi:Zn-dependent protease
MEELQQIVLRARHFTSSGQLDAAKQQWLVALQLLPPGTSEYQGVVQEIHRLEAKMQPQAEGKQWTKRLGPFGVVIAFLLKFKTALLLLLGKGGFLFNILGFLIFYWALYGWWFGVGLFFSILIHEFGHYITARRLGFAADLPRFHIFGAYVRWGGVGMDVNIVAIVALAGPFFGFIAGLISYGVYLQTGRGVWLGVAEFTAWLNLLNLIPVWIFDGARAMSAIGKQERIAIAVVSILLAVLLHTWLPAFVAGATIFRLISRDFPSQPRQRVAYAYIGLVLATSFLSWFCIHQKQLRFGDQEQHQVSFQKNSASERLT